MFRPPVFIVMLISASVIAALGVFVTMRPTRDKNLAPAQAPVVDRHVSNREARSDRLSRPVRAVFGHSDGGPTAVAVPPSLSEPLLSDGALVKPGNEPPSNASYSVVSNAQIEALKQRLKLTPQQSVHWPAVEKALREVAGKVHASRRIRGASDQKLIDPDGVEIRSLRSAAEPLLARLREDQKREIRMLAQVIGLQAVVSRL